MPTVFTGKKPSEWTQATINAVKAALGIPKEYSALLLQQGTGDPTVVDLYKNTLGGNIAWARTSEGMYFGSLTSNLLTDHKTMILDPMKITWGGPTVGLNRYANVTTFNQNGISIDNYSDTAATTHADYFYFTVQILVYP